MSTARPAKAWTLLIDMWVTWPALRISNTGQRIAGYLKLFTPPVWQFADGMENHVTISQQDRQPQKDDSPKQPAFAPMLMEKVGNRILILCP